MARASHVDAAVRLVLDEGLNQTEAARRTGASQSAVNKRFLRESAPRTPCACGCGGLAVSSYIHGHNGRVKTRWLAEDRGYETPCWIWQLKIGDGGYGHVGSVHLAHRVMYEEVHGVIPMGMQLDHLCRQRDCVNPSHLEVVTPRENCLRGESLAAQNARKTHCVNGHPFTEANTYIHRGRRRCRTCRVAATRRFKVARALR